MRTDIRDSSRMLQRNAKTIRTWLEESGAAKCAPALYPTPYTIRTWLEESGATKCARARCLEHRQRSSVGFSCGLSLVC